MDISLQFQKISETFIKPSSPTPSSLRFHKLSYVDQLLDNFYMPFAFFYPKIHDQGGDISQVLRISLSKTLTYYYPFAGRLMNNLFIDCNDMGVQLIEARIKFPMFDILKQPMSDLKDLVFSRSLHSSIFILPGDSLLTVQLNYFECGGIVVSACLSHKLGDGYTVCTFMNDWADMARHELSGNDHLPSAPQFNGASILPPVDDLLLVEGGVHPPPQGENFVSRRFVFESSKIEELKAMAVDSSVGVDNPTRFEVVAALVFSCAISAVANSGSFQPFIFSNTMNIRPLTIPPFPQKYIGNFATIFQIVVTDHDEAKFPKLVHKIREGKLKCSNELKVKMEAIQGPVLATAAKLLEEFGRNNFDSYSCTSLCTFPFYDVDFGWGRPSLVSPANLRGLRHGFMLMDTKNGEGIDVYVRDKELNMPIFEAKIRKYVDKRLNLQANL